MLKFLQKILFFTLSLPFFWFLSVGVWGFLAPTRYQSNIIFKQGAYGHMYSRLEEVKEVHDIDVLALGSSHAYRGFDPRIFEKYDLKLFNLGSSSQSPIQTEFLVRKYIENLNTDWVIWEVYPYTMTNKGVESSLDLVSNEDMDLNLFYYGCSSLHLKVMNTTLYSTWHQFFNEEYEEGIIKKNDTYIRGGFVEKSIDKFYKKSAPEMRKVEFENKQLEAFERTLKLLSKHKVKVLLCFAPITRPYYQAIENFSEVSAYYSHLDGVQYLNFNEMEMGLTDTLHFYDQHHLNQQGVEVFNHYLLENHAFD